MPELHEIERLLKISTNDHMKLLLVIFVLRIEPSIRSTNENSLQVLFNRQKNILKSNNLKLLNTIGFLDDIYLVKYIINIVLNI